MCAQVVIGDKSLSGNYACLPEKARHDTDTALINIMYTYGEDLN